MPHRWGRLSLGVSPSPSGGVGLRASRGPVLLALMVSTGLIAMDATILATAVPSIVRDVGGFDAIIGAPDQAFARPERDDRIRLARHARPHPRGGSRNRG